MFSGCSKLNSWTVALPNSLTDASYMFSGCTGLKSWTVELPNSLTYASCMFWDCTGLNSWTVALPNSLTNAAGMFEGCTGLTSFQSDMPTGLTSNASSMFSYCKLDITSVERISRTIANCTATDYWDKTIHLGVSQACHDNTNFGAYIKKMSDPIDVEHPEQGGKGWNVVVVING